MAALCIRRHAMNLMSTGRAFASLPTSPPIGFHGRPPLLRIPFGSSLHVTMSLVAWCVRAVHGASMAEPLASKKDQEREESPENWTIKMLCDGDCPLGMREVMGGIHAILADGTIVTDVEAFRRSYEQVGLGWVYAITKYEPIASIADAVYGVWAKYRLQLTGRPPMDEIMESQRKDKGEACNDRSKYKM